MSADLETLRTLLASDPNVVELKFPREVVAELVAMLEAQEEESYVRMVQRDEWRDQATTGMDALREAMVKDREQLAEVIVLLNQAYPHLPATSDVKGKVNAFLTPDRTHGRFDV